ncbi:MAG: hypothetical protein ACLP6G_11920 [Terriglobales bacterium]
MKTLIVTMCMMALLPLALAEEKKPATLTAADAKNHVGETATVCGKVVDTKVAKYGLQGRGKLVVFDIDQPEPNPIFNFMTFGTKEGGPQEAVDAYKDKNVCVTGPITKPPSGPPSIFVVDRSVVTVAPDAK